MTPDQARTLHHFAWNEFKHPDLVAYPFAIFLDDVREAFGAPLVLTSDARTAAENAAANGSPTSLHLQGRAADLHWTPNDAALARFVIAVVTVAAGRPFELEIDVNAASPHLHLGLFPDPAHAATLFVHA